MHIFFLGSRSAAASPTVSNGRTSIPYQGTGQKISTNTAESGFIRKSHVVGTDLVIKSVESSLSGEEIIRNGKRKGEYTATPDIGKFVECYSYGSFLCTCC